MPQDSSPAVPWELACKGTSRICLFFLRCFVYPVILDILDPLCFQPALPRNCILNHNYSWCLNCIASIRCLYLYVSFKGQSIRIKKSPPSAVTPP